MQYITKIVPLMFLLMSMSIAEDLANVAVLDLELNGIDSMQRTPLSNRLRTELFKTNAFNVLERARMTDILKEQGLQQTGCTSTECAVEVGQLLNVEKIIIGSIDLIGMTYTVQIRMVDVRTGKMENAISEDCSKCQLEDILKSTIRKVAFQLANKPSEQTNSIEPKHDNMSYGTMAVVRNGNFAFAIDKYEVTQAEYVSIMGLKKFSIKDCSKCPADKISIIEARKYCAMIGKRLPSEVEWEIAARSYPEGFWDALQRRDRLKYSWFRENSSLRVQEIGNLQPNSYGLYDMLGNVWEWTSETGSTTNTTTSFGVHTTIVPTAIRKGGCYSNSANRMTIQEKYEEQELDEKDNGVGFRCASDIR